MHRVNQQSGGAGAYAAFASVLRTTVQQGGSGIDRFVQLRQSPPSAAR